MPINREKAGGGRSSKLCFQSKGRIQEEFQEVACVEERTKVIRGRFIVSGAFILTATAAHGGLGEYGTDGRISPFHITHDDESYGQSVE